ncbi:MAG: polysaccharide biosynthesis tyrosine autokinase [Gammaproteobacteria bacterium]|jgi:polysaccharide biosynthesis transport protein|nr:polysaccharide biosynthesis tyrosine autokinase [Gammaproteobacteria bacterium]|tara:strand:+ start:5419 stop:7659 length:2241 start_codon:yes stop_codon:yes gene_type:complete
MAPKGTEQLEASLFGEDTIDFGQYWQTIRRYQWRIISLAFIVTILVAMVVMSMTPVYRASSSLLIEAEEAKVVSIEEIYGLNSNRKEYFETQYEILKSRQIAEKVVDKLNLVEHPLYNKEESNGISSFIKDLKSTIKEGLPFLPQTPKVDRTEEELLFAKRKAVTDKVVMALTISPVKNTQVVKITFESESPKLAATIANAFAETYIENYLESKFAMTSKATTWLNDSLLGLREKLVASESALTNFYEENQVVDLDGVVGLASEELQDLNSELVAAESRLKQSAIIYEQVRRYQGDVEELAKLPEVLNHPSIQSVKRAELEAESKVSELSKVYGPKHQRMISATAELNSVQKSLNKQIQALISGITSEYQQLQSRVEGLRQTVNSSKQDYRRLTTLESQRRKLQREVDINQQLYNSFFTRLKETSEVGGFETANARILDEALAPTIPAKPKKGLIIAAAFVVSLGMGVFLALALEALNRGIRSVEDVEKKLGQRMLGLIPWQKHKRKEDLPLRQFFDNKHHSFSEAIRTLRTSLQLLHLDSSQKVFMVTSSEPKEGKTTVSINLAFAMGQLGKVLLIEADLRRPTIAKQFGFPGFQPGLANLISGTHTLDECLVNDVNSGIDIICSGTIPPTPQELLASHRFRDLISEFRATYDHIIIDTAPTQAVSDAMVVSNCCDTLLYVVKADSTSDKLINSGLTRFMQAGKRVDGVVLNQVDMKKASKSYDYVGFYDRYGYQSDTAEEQSKT